MTVETTATGQSAIDRKRIAELTEREVAKLTERTPESKRRYERAVKVMPGGVPSSFQENDPWPVYIERGEGTKVWDVEAVKGPRRNVIQPKSIVDNKKGCVAQTPTPGFDVTVTRIFKKGGKQVKTSQFNTHYIPEDKVTCTNP